MPMAVALRSGVLNALSTGQEARRIAGDGKGEDAGNEVFHQRNDAPAIAPCEVPSARAAFAACRRLLTPSLR
jgi:hypothetical protein